MKGHKINDGKPNRAIFHYVLKSSTGEIIETDNLYQFCIVYKLNPKNMERVVNGKRPHHKNYTLISKTRR